MKKSIKKPLHPRDGTPPSTGKKQSVAATTRAAQSAATHPPKRGPRTPKRSPEPRGEVPSEAELSEAGRKLRAARDARPHKRKSKPAKTGSKPGSGRSS